MDSQPSQNATIQLDILFEGPASGSNGGPDERIDIIAVPGIGPAASSPWREGEVNWLKDDTMLPYWLPNARIVQASYEHLDLATPIQQWIPLLAKELLRTVLAKRRSHPKRPLIVVGHSLGGLIMKEAILFCESQPELYPLLPSIVGIAFFGTPQRSKITDVKSGWAFIETLICADDTGNLAESLVAVEKADDSFDVLSQEFARVAVVHHIPLFCFFEQPQQGTILVDKYSATIDGFRNAALTVDHFHLGKFKAADDANYILVRDELIKFAQDATVCIANRVQFSTNEVEKCLNALFITDPADDVALIEQNKGYLLEGSGSWLASDPNYNEWIDCKGSRVLWLSGGPGKGKTMLAISALKNIAEKIHDRSSGPSVILAHFFCNAKDNRRNSSIAILRGLIYQLLHIRPDLSSQFRALFGKEGDQLFSSPTALHSLWRILKDFFASPGLQRVYIVIDALDELDDESIDDVLKLLSPLLDFEQLNINGQSRSDQTDLCEVKWFLTSRNEATISDVLCQTLNISLEKNVSHVQNAVSQFIDVRVKDLREEKGYSSNLASVVANKLGEISEGTFLYVSMACGTLARPSVRLLNTDKVLQTFPKGLLPLYEKMIIQLHTAPEEDVQYAKAILRTMALAVRPLSLQELGVMASLPEDHCSDINALQEYTALCGSFITVQQGTIYFVHESVKEYLMTSPEIFPEPIPEYHGRLAELFIQMIQNPLQPDLERDEKVSYPRLFWIDHARQAGSAIKWEKYLSTHLLQWSQRSQIEWFTSYWASYHAKWNQLPENFTPLHFAAYGGIYDLAATLIANGAPINDIDSDGCTALMWASKRGFPEVVKLLLELGADPEIRTSLGLTAVFFASINGRYRSLENLIQAGAQVRIMDSSDCTPVHYASAYGNTKTLNVLLAAGADIDTVYGSRTPIQFASYRGELPIVKVLVAHNADVGVKDKEGRTLLHLAVRSNELNTIDFWLKNSNDLETKDRQSWTPLMHAASFGNDRAAAYLIKRGVNIEAKTREGHSPLSIATLNGRIGVVKALLEGGANPNSGCKMNETPLQQAAWLGHVSICQLLLEAGADANAQTNHKLTPLHQAATNGHEVTAKLLLQYGANPNAIDSDGLTPSARAEEAHHRGLAKYLKRREVGSEDIETLTRTESQNHEPLDPAVCELLKISPESGFMEPHGNEGFSRPHKVTAFINGKATHYFMKSGLDEDMFESENQALREIKETVPTLAPYTLGCGKYADSSRFFLLMEWFDILSNEDAPSKGGEFLSLPQKLAKLHTTTAKTPPGHHDPKFGWPRSTYCGSTKQNNSYRASWDKFFAENRLITIIDQIEERHGSNKELRAAMQPVIETIVPRLLRNGHLGGRRGILPVLCHGDLWHGNKAYGSNPAWDGPEYIVFDPSACYCHSEYELSIMRCFGGYSAGFYHEYHRLVPKTEPIHEYEDRIALYQLYHYLNHYYVFRGAYKDTAMDIVKKLVAKYVTD